MQMNSIPQQAASLRPIGTDDVHSAASTSSMHDAQSESGDFSFTKLMMEAAGGMLGGEGAKTPPPTSKASVAAQKITAAADPMVDAPQGESTMAEVPGSVGPVPHAAQPVQSAVATVLTDSAVDVSVNVPATTASTVSRGPSAAVRPPAAPQRPAVAAAADLLGTAVRGHSPGQGDATANASHAASAGKAGKRPSAPDASRQTTEEPAAAALPVCVPNQTVDTPTSLAVATSNAQEVAPPLSATETVPPAQAIVPKVNGKGKPLPQTVNVVAESGRTHAAAADLESPQGAEDGTSVPRHPRPADSVEPASPTSQELTGLGTSHTVASPSIDLAGTQPGAHLAGKPFSVAPSAARNVDVHAVTAWSPGSPATEGGSIAHSANALEIGFRDDALGWLSVRASAADGLHATISAGSHSSSETLRTMLPGLDRFLEEHSISMASLSVKQPATTEGAAGTPQATAPAWTGGAATAATADGMLGGRAQGQGSAESDRQPGRRYAPELSALDRGSAEQAVATTTMAPALTAADSRYRLGSNVDIRI